MNNKIIRRIIFIIIVLLIFIIGLILYLINNKNKSTNSNNEDILSKKSFEQLQSNEGIKECNIANDYFIVKKIISEYFSYCSNLGLKASDINTFGSKISDEELEKSAQRGRQKAQNIIYNRLFSDYISELDIKKEDIQKKFLLPKDIQTIIEKVYSMKISDNVSIFFVYGTNVDKSQKTKESFQLGTIIDKLNNTYAILPEEYCNKHKYNNIELGDILDISIDTIQKNENNLFNTREIGEDEICQEYFYKYKNSMLYNPEYAYELIDKDYREKRFKSLDNYIKYINNNYEDIKKRNISKYDVYENNGNKRYVCTDGDENYYIFNEKTLFNYALYLDTYTIDTEEFLKKYNTASDTEKVGMNIERLIESINSKDYNYIYNHLHQSFKENYYNNQNELESYLKDKLFLNNYIENIEFSNEGEIIIAKVTVFNKIDKEQSIEMTINMKLNEGTDFVMSFSID